MFFVSSRYHAPCGCQDSTFFPPYTTSWVYIILISIRFIVLSYLLIDFWGSFSLSFLRLVDYFRSSTPWIPEAVVFYWYLKFFVFCCNFWGYFHHYIFWSWGYFLFLFFPLYLKVVAVSLSEELPEAPFSKFYEIVRRLILSFLWLNTALVKPLYLIVELSWVFPHHNKLTKLPRGHQAKGYNNKTRLSLMGETGVWFWGTYFCDITFSLVRSCLAMIVC